MAIFGIYVRFLGCNLQYSPKNAIYDFGPFLYFVKFVTSTTFLRGLRLLTSVDLKATKSSVVLSRNAGHRGKQRKHRTIVLLRVVLGRKLKIKVFHASICCESVLQPGGSCCEFDRKVVVDSFYWYFFHESMREVSYVLVGKHSPTTSN